MHVAPEVVSPTPGRLRLKWLLPKTPRVFVHERGRQRILGRWGKTPSLFTRMVVVPRQHGPELDFRGVQDTVPHSTSTITQTRARFAFQ